MRIRLLFFLTLISVVSPILGRGQNAVLTDRSFGGVRVGMTVRQASRVLGVKLVAERDTGAECRYFEAKGKFRDVGFMTSYGKIVRFDISERGFATDRGIRVGDTEARVRRVYRGRFKVETHKYIDGNYIYVSGRKFGMVFETDGKKVILIRAGRFPEAGYVEGCS